MADKRDGKRTNNKSWHKINKFGLSTNLFISAINLQLKPLEQSSPVEYFMGMFGKLFISPFSMSCKASNRHHLKAVLLHYPTVTCNGGLEVTTGFGNCYYIEPVDLEAIHHWEQPIRSPLKSIDFLINWDCNQSAIFYVVCNNLTFYCILTFICVLLFISITITSILLWILLVSSFCLYRCWCWVFFHFCLFCTFLYITVLSVSEMEISISRREPPKGINKVVYLSSKQVLSHLI